ncbi:SH3 and multiple ankyrin repeat domains protein 1-like [Penaeus japonicus]|uniref:SH3 and multiple ankyrin repeat domains protein 1-like n=1 Tax=Penaeus japonicus TaxID=27405 RepID=UPI001C70F52D|nr:SH3 and multiple ankyrin repeat domains protein 1-like [Penaeus japonicus]
MRQQSVRGLCLLLDQVLRRRPGNMELQHLPTSPVFPSQERAASVLRRLDPRPSGAPSHLLAPARSFSWGADGPQPLQRLGGDGVLHGGRSESAGRSDERPLQLHHGAHSHLHLDPGAHNPHAHAPRPHAHQHSLHHPLDPHHRRNTPDR